MISKERSEAITQAMSAISRERQASIKQLISEVSIERKALIQQTSKDVVVKAFNLGAALIALLLVGAIIARLIYRYLELKLFERRTHFE